MFKRGEEKKKKGKRTAGLTVKQSSLFDPPNLSFTPLHSHPIMRGEKKRKEGRRRKKKRAAHFL